MARVDEVIGYGTHAARPAASSAGVLYYETDTDTLFRDNGATWDTLTLGSGDSSAIKQVVPLSQSGDNSNIGSSGSYSAYPNLSGSIVIAAGSSIRVRVQGTFLGVMGAGAWVSLKAVIGSTTVPLGAAGFGGDNYFSPLACEGVLDNPGAGTYAISLTYKTSAASGLYCRPAGQPALESMSVMVEEYT